MSLELKLDQMSDEPVQVLVSLGWVTIRLCLLTEGGRFFDQSCVTGARQAG
jgi:hypothetical protein